MLRSVVVAVVAATVVLLFTWAESTGKQARQAEAAWAAWTAWLTGKQIYVPC